MCIRDRSIGLSIFFSECLLMHKIHSKRAPSYLTDKVTATADLQSRAVLRSTSTSKYHTPRTRIKFGKRSFSYAGPSAWNSLPHHVWEITDTTRFKRQLKTVLFQSVYVVFGLLLFILYTPSQYSYFITFLEASPLCWQHTILFLSICFRLQHRSALTFSPTDIFLHVC